MKPLIFASRNGKEILRDPLNLAFGIGFPLVLLLLLSAIQKNVPFDLFEIQRLSPGIAVFGLSFMSLFSATLIAKDRTTSYLTRLFASPLSAKDYILGYATPMLPIAAAQSALCFVASFFFGLRAGAGVLAAIAALIPAAALYIGLGLLTGSLFTDKQVGGICGALLTNVSAWLSGTWFDLDLVGGTFKKIAYLLPFAHAVDAGRAALSLDFSGVWPHLLWVAGYAAAASVAAAVVFSRKMRSDKN